MKKKKNKVFQKKDHISKNNRDIVLRILKKPTKENLEKDEFIELKKSIILPINDFLDELQKTKDLVFLLMNFVSINLKDSIETIETVKKENKVSEDEEIIKLIVDKKTKKNFDNSWNKISLLKNAPNKILESFLNYTFSLYENFFSRQLTLLFEKFPSKLSDEKKLSYEDFTQYTSIEEIQKYYVDSTIRSILNSNTFDQIKTLDKLIDNEGIFTKTLPLNYLVEISSRRNLYVHNEGRINKDYKERLKTVDINVKEKDGVYLKMDKDYFEKVFDVIYESTAKISYLVGCKCFSGDDYLEKIDNFINALIVELIENNKIDLAITLLDFVCEYINKNKKHKSIIKMYLSINKALCYKINQDKEMCEEILSQNDFSGVSNEVKFASYILREEREKALGLMPFVSVIDSTKDEKDEAKIFDSSSYQTLPIFFEFRERNDFKVKYKEIFGYEFGEDKSEN